MARSSAKKKDSKTTSPERDSKTSEQSPMQKIFESIINDEITKVKEGNGHKLITPFFDPIALQKKSGIFRDYKEKLNQDCKKATVLGIGTGDNIKPLKYELNWKITGYDFSPAAITYLKKEEKDIPVHQVDFCQPSSSYAKLLAKDFQTATNVIALYLLQYLLPYSTNNTENIVNLLKTCLQSASVGTVFFIANHVFLIDPAEVIQSNSKPCLVVNKDKAAEEAVRKKEKMINQVYTESAFILQRGLVSSFFAARTDIECVLNEDFLPFTDSLKKQVKIPSFAEAGTEVLIYRKR